MILLACWCFVAVLVLLSLHCFCSFTILTLVSCGCIYITRSSLSSSQEYHFSKPAVVNNIHAEHNTTLCVCICFVSWLLAVWIESSWSCNSQTTFAFWFLSSLNAHIHGWMLNITLYKVAISEYENENPRHFLCLS